MPQDTFFNLPQDRQREILNAAFEEFALNDYASASLSTIISGLDLAKGSFYRYFESKLDLYFYLRQFSDNLVETNFVNHLTGASHEFFQDWRDFYLSLGEIEKDFPFAIRFRFKVAFEQDKEVISRQKLDKVEGRTRFMSAIIRKYQDGGSLRKDMDADFFSILLTFFNFALSEFIDIKHAIAPTSPIFAIDPKIVEQETESALDILRQGASPRLE